MDPDQERSAAEVRALADALVGASPEERRAELPRWCDELRALVARPPRARPDDFWDRVQGWNRLGDALGDLQKRVAELDDEIRKALLPICLEAMARHPGRCFHRLPLPVDPELIEPLVALLHASSAHVEPADVARYDGNPQNIIGFSGATDALERLLAYREPAHVERAIAALTSRSWSDDQLSVLARILHWKSWGGHSLGKALTPESVIAKNALPALLAPTSSCPAYVTRLVRLQLLDRRALGARARLPTLPRSLPTDVSSALALAEKWRLRDEDLRRGPPATPTELDALERALGRPLPHDVRELLCRVSSIGDRQLGPIARLAALQAELQSTFEAHLRDDDGAPIDTEDGDVDVRRFLPSESWLAIGSDAGGDLFFVACATTTRSGTHPVVRYRHDESLVARLWARSIGEHAALLFAEAYARREGLDFDRFARRRLP
jgi:cell wall assembly regulator SMI1